MYWDMLQKIHCIKSRCFGTCCKKSTAFIHAAGIHFIQSCCMVSTAFNRDVLGHAALNPLHSIGMLWAMLQNIHCIQSCCRNPLHSIMLHKIHWIPQGSISSCCMESTAFNHAAWNPLHSIGMHFTRLHGLHCIQAQCMESTAFNDAAWNPLHWIGMLLAMLHKIHCIQSCCTVSTAFNRDVLGHAAENPLH